MTYTPNFNDPRVIKKVERALGFVLGVFKPDESRAYSTRYMDKFFGQQQNQLGKYLRGCLLITTKETWSIELHKCKEYLLNAQGVDFLKQQIGIPVKKSTSVDLSIQKALLSSTPDLKSSSDKRLDYNYTITPYCITSPQKSINTYDRYLVEQVFSREFQQELNSLDFNYLDKSNRWWHPLQNVRSEYRTGILANKGLAYQYDIDSAAPTLIMYYSHQLGMSEYTKAIRDYIQHRQAIRQDLAQRMEVDEKIVKVLINALFCGARLGNNENFATSQLLLQDPARIELFKTDPFIQQLRTDIATCWSYIKPTIPVEYTLDKLGRSRRKPFNSRQKWQVYFQLERQVMSVIREHLWDTDNKFFLEHDGWTSSKPVDIAQVVDLIKQATGFTITIKSKQIKEN